MKSNLLFFSLLFSIAVLFTPHLRAQCTGDWVLPFEVPEGGQGWGTTIGPDNAIYMSFNFAGSITLPSVDGQSEMLQSQYTDGSSIGVAAYSPTGNLLWSTAFHSTGPFYFGYSLAITDNALFLSGPFVGDLEVGSILLEATGTNNLEAFYARLSLEDGEAEWASQFVSGEWAANLGMTVNPEGELLLTGFFGGPSIVPGGSELSDGNGIGANQRHMYLIEVNPENGAANWVQQSDPYETMNLVYNRGWGIHVDNAGFIYVAGMYCQELRIDDQVLDSGDVIFLPYVGKFAADGNCLWLRGGTEASEPIPFNPAYGVTTDPAGNVYFTGAIQGDMMFDTDLASSADEEDIFVAKYDANGSFDWVQVMGDADADAPDAEWGTKLNWTNNHLLLTANLAANPVIDGTTYSGNGGRDIALITLDDGGTVNDAQFLGGSGAESTYETIYDNNGDLIVNGVTNSPEAQYGSVFLELDTAGTIYFFLYKQCLNPVSSTTEAGARAWQIYPNPVGDELFIEGKLPDGTAWLEICDMTGRCPQRIPLDQSGNISAVRVGTLPTGPYMLRMRSENGASLGEELFIRVRN